MDKFNHMTTKREVYELRNAGLLTEVFSHSELGHFNISALEHAVQFIKKKLGKAPVTRICNFEDIRCAYVKPGQTGIEYVFQNRDIDEAHAALLTDEELEQPVFVVEVPATKEVPATSLIVDGIHRVFERHKRGMKDFKYYSIPLDVAPRISEEEFLGALNFDWGEYELKGQQLVHKVTGKPKGT